MRACVEQRLVLVRERDVDYHWGCDGKEAIAQRRAQFPGVVCGEVLEDQGAVDASYRVELKTAYVRTCI